MRSRRSGTPATVANLALSTKADEKHWLTNENEEVEEIGNDATT
jgi:hypothetical protein